MKTMKRINSIKVSKIVDTDPDLSDLGEYSNQEKPGAIDREARGEKGRNEFRYFVPAMTGEQTGNPESPEQDYKRMEAYNRQEWGMFGVKAVAEVALSFDGGKTWKLDYLTSGGLWGIESDSEASCFEEVKRDELANLTQILEAYGFDPILIYTACEKVKLENE